MPTLLALARGIDRMNRVLGRLAAFMVLIAAVISAGNAMSRYAFDASSNAWLEIQWYLFAGMVMFGASETLRRNEHVRVDLIYSNVSDRTRLWIDAVGFVLFFLPFTILMAWLCWPVAVQSLVTGEGSSSSGGLIRWPVKMILAAGFSVLALQGVSELIKRIAALRGDIVLSTDYEKPQQ